MFLYEYKGHTKHCIMAIIKYECMQLLNFNFNMYSAANWS